MLGKYSPTVANAYRKDQKWFKPVDGTYDEDGYDSYGYNSEGLDREGNTEYFYSSGDAYDGDEEDVEFRLWNEYRDVESRWSLKNGKIIRK